MKNALVYARDDTTLEDALPKFLRDKNYLEYRIWAVLNENRTGFLSVADPNGKESLRFNSAGQLEVLTPQAVNKFVYDFVDAIFILSEKNLGTEVQKFIDLNVAPRKIILWNEQGTVEPLTFEQQDGTPVVFFEGLEFHLKNRQDEEFMKQTLHRMRNQKVFRKFPREYYAFVLKDIYRHCMDREPDLDNPKTYTEKINWLKLYDSTPLKARLADKFSVRDYVSDKIGADKLKPLLGAWDSFDEINFDDLPDKFVLKCNHGSGMNIIVKDKSKFDLREAREKINAWLAFDYGASFLELHYSLIKRKIVAEQYIKEVETGLYDYKVHCFNGEPKIIQVLQTQNLHGLGNSAAHQAFYDPSWKNLGAMFEDAPLFPNPIPRPLRLEEMLNCARILCEPFSYSRADFYEIANEIFFAEITFYSDAGLLPYKRTWTYERDLEIGNIIKL